MIIFHIIALILLFIIVIGGIYFSIIRVIELNKRDKEITLKVEAAFKALTSLNNCADLLDLLSLHKSLGNVLNLNSNRNLGPCEYGMFRTKDISTMSGNEVYLGNIYGLNTLSLNTWLKSGNSEDISIVFHQYRNHLESNLKCMTEIKYWLK